MFTPNARCTGQLIAAGALVLLIPVMFLHKGPPPRHRAPTRHPALSPTPVRSISRRARRERTSPGGKRVAADLERREYTPSPTPQGLEAPNRAHNLRTTFGERGIEVLPRTEREAAPTWRFAWETVGFGRPDWMQEVSSSSPSSAGARVIYERDGWSEWYENTAKGLEQGFTIERRPAGDGPLQITGKVPGALRAEMRDDGAIDFIERHGACAIRYGELHTWDAKR